MNSQPDDTKASSSKKANPLEILRKPVPKLAILIRGEVCLDIKAKGVLIIFLIDADGLLLLVFGLTGGISLLAAILFLLLLSFSL